MNRYIVAFLSFSQMQIILDVYRLPGFARVPSLPPALPHCLTDFLKLSNVFNDNVQSIRYI